MTNELYNECYKLALRITCDKHNAEDLLHDSIEKAYTALDAQTIKEMQQRKEFKFYLSRIMLNHFYNLKKNNKEFCIDYEHSPVEEVDNTKQIQEDKIEQIKEIIDMLKSKSKTDWFYAHLYELYNYEVFLSNSERKEDEKKHTYRSIQKMTNIGLGTIYEAVQQVNNYLKNRLND